jgi:hypothetical protein
VVVVLVLAALGGGFFLYGTMNDPFRALETLDARSYLDNAASLRGNVYKLKGSIINLLAWTPTDGKLISVEVEAGSGIEYLPLLLPAEFNFVNIQRGQRFHFKVNVRDKGVLQVLEMEKL